MTTRAEFMGRVRSEVARSGGLFTASVAERPARPAEHVEAIRRQIAERWPETLERFQREFERVGGVLHRVAQTAAIPEIIAGIARERGMRRIVTWHPAALGMDLVPSLAGLGLEARAMPADVPDAAERATLRATIAAADIGVTAVDLAIAETGSLLLVSDAGRPRSTSLLPPCHVAIFDRTALVESLAQVGVFLEAWHAGPLSAERGAAISIITGPSRTADIELTLTRGVHGPKDVHAIFADEAASPSRG